MAENDARTDTTTDDAEKPKSRAGKKSAPVENPAGALDAAAAFYPKAHPGNADVAPPAEGANADGQEAD